MILITNSNNLIATNARKSNKWKEIEPGIFVSDDKDIDKIEVLDEE